MPWAFLTFIYIYTAIVYKSGGKFMHINYAPMTPKIWVKFAILRLQTWLYAITGLEIVIFGR